MPATFVGFNLLPANTVAKYKAAFANAKYYVALARNQARTIWSNRTRAGPAFQQARDRFQLFWGPITQALCQTVSDNLGHIHNGLLGDLEIRYDGTNANAKAYVYNAHMAAAPGGVYTARIHFCPALILHFAAIGTNSAMGTIVHEMSHLTCATADHIYGMRSCTTQIAANKVTNADNYKYYTEQFQYRLGTDPVLDDRVSLHQPPVRV